MLRCSSKLHLFNKTSNFFTHSQNKLMQFTKIKIKSTFKFVTYSFIGFYFLKSLQKKKELKSCGIIGYIGKEKNGVEVCVEGVQILQFRGYDSAGVCSIDSKGEFQITKYASDFFGLDQGDCIKKIADNVPKIHEASSIGIAHTRWATHGRKINLNAHPHTDFSGKIAIVHNGIIDNYKEIKDFLKSQNIDMVSETDTEVIAQLIGFYYSKGIGFKESVSKTLNNHIVGSYALAIMNKDHPDTIIAARSGSPLLVGIGKDFFIVSSDVSAFQKYTNNYFNIENQDIVELNLNMHLSHLKIQVSLSEEILTKPKEPYEHFMLQEIMEQPETINRAMNYGSRFKTISHKFYGIKLGGLEQYVEFLKNAKNLVIISCGTSYFASLFVSNLMRKLNIFNTIQLVDGAEFTVDYLPQENPICIFVSQSGETYDILRPLELCKNKGVICLGIVNKVESTLARSVLCGVFVNAGREISVASTKAFSGQVVALTLATLFFAQIKFESIFSYKISLFS
jgi:glucosamine--fructose-6-phosphate aminotransferase (isomerizing)